MEKKLDISLNEDKEKINNENNLILTPLTNKTTDFQTSLKSSYFNPKNKKNKILKEEKKRYLMKEKEKQKLSKNRFWRKFNFEKKYNLIQQPKSPHNTGQYLIHMFNSKKKNDIFNFEEINEIPLNLKRSVNEVLFNNIDEMEFDLDEALGIESNHKRERYMSAEYNFIPNNGFKLINQESNNINIINDNDVNDDLSLKKYKSLFD